MKSKVFYGVLSLVSVLFGAFLMLTSQVKVLGAVVGIENLTSFRSVSFGLVFIILGLLLFTLERRRKKE